MFKKLFITGLVFINISLPLALTEEIYRSNSDNGSVSFSNKPKDKSEVVVTLPAIIKQKKVISAENPVLNSCSAYGGIDCTKGADDDGSVICYNGFKDSLERYAFSCSRTKLKIIEQSLVSHNGKTKFIVRNVSSVNAENIIVQSKLCKKIEGAQSIAAYDSEEFICDAELKNAQSIKIDCENC